MTIISTLRSLAFQFCDNLWWIFSGWLSAPTGSLVTLTSLNDDCIWIILNTFSVGRLFQLRAVSRRLCHFIEQNSLPQVKTLIYGYEKAGENKKRPCLEHSGTVEVYFSRRTHVYSQFCKRTGFFFDQHERILPVSELVPIRLCTLPLSLPFLLPRLSCLTFTYFLADQEQMFTQEQLTINQLAVAYLDSHWSTTIKSLHLYIEVPSRPKPDNDFFSLLNSLTTVQHLYLEFSHFIETDNLPLLPNSMPVLGNLLSFSLHFYGGSNVSLLLHQLGPELVFLSLFEVICSVDDYATFLGVKPTYEDTLKTLEVHLYNTYDWELFKVTTQCFSSLERLFIRAFPLPNENLVPIFTDLGLLPHLREFLYLAMSISQLSHLYHRHLPPGALPTLTSIRQVTIIIYLPEGETFDSIEFLYHIVPLLLGIFGSLENLCLQFIALPSTQEHINQVLSGILTNWVKKLFPGIRHCTAYYYLRKQNFLET